MSVRAVACALCGASRARVFLEARDHVHVKLGRPYAFAACGRCGVHFLVPPRASAATCTGTTPWCARSWREARAAASSTSAAGSVTGSRRRVRRGSRRRGSTSALRSPKRRARSGCPVFVGPLVRRFASLLAPGGLVRVFGYATDSLAARLKGARWWNYTPTRRFLFSDRTIGTLAREAGLEVMEVLHGGEQPLARYLEENPVSAPAAKAKDALRFTLERVRVGGVSFGSARAWYLRRP